MGDPWTNPYELPFVRVCDFCGENIPRGEAAVTLYLGVIGPGAKSGLPSVIEGMNSWGPAVVLHPWCVKHFAHNHVYDDAEEEEERLRYCAGCEARLDPESDDGC